MPRQRLQNCYLTYLAHIEHSSPLKTESCYHYSPGLAKKSCSYLTYAGSESSKHHGIYLCIIIYQGKSAEEQRDRSGAGGTSLQKNLTTRTTESSKHSTRESSEYTASLSSTHAQTVLSPCLCTVMGRTPRSALPLASLSTGAGAVPGSNSRPSVAAHASAPDAWKPRFVGDNRSEVPGEKCETGSAGHGEGFAQKMIAPLWPVGPEAPLRRHHNAFVAQNGKSGILGGKNKRR